MNRYSDQTEHDYKREGFHVLPKTALAIERRPKATEGKTSPPQLVGCAYSAGMTMARTIRIRNTSDLTIVVDGTAYISGNGAHFFNQTANGKRQAFFDCQFCVEICE